jgi:hypothetical protein
MSKVMTPAQLVAQLKRWEVPYREEDGWRARGRPGAYGDMHGIANHHTATSHKAKPAAVDRLLRVGRPDLSGPLAQFGTRRDGTVSLIAHGRSNHAGAVRPSVLRAFLADKVVKRPLTSSGETVDANAFLYGNEVHHDGGGNYTDAQLLSLVLLNAAICDFHDWPASAVAQHSTITRRKVDMAAPRVHGIKTSMDRWLRREVARALKAGPGQYALPWQPQPATSAVLDVDTPTEEDCMTLVIAPNGSAYHLTPKGLVWLPADVHDDITGPVTVVRTDEGTWKRYRGAYKLLKP